MRYISRESDAFLVLVCDGNVNGYESRSSNICVLQQTFRFFVVVVFMRFENSKVRVSWKLENKARISLIRKSEIPQIDYFGFLVGYPWKKYDISRRQAAYSIHRIKSIQFIVDFD